MEQDIFAKNYKVYCTALSQSESSNFFHVQDYFGYHEHWVTNTRILLNNNDDDNPNYV